MRVKRSIHYLKNVFLLLPLLMICLGVPYASAHICTPFGVNDYMQNTVDPTGLEAGSTLGVSGHATYTSDGQVHTYDCSPSTHNSPAYISTRYVKGAPVYSGYGGNYVPLDGTDDILITVNPYAISGHSSPLTSELTGKTSVQCGQDVGSQCTSGYGQIMSYIYIKNPIAGNITIPSQPVENIWISTGQDGANGDHKILWIGLGIHVPVSCSLDPGMVEIDLGNITQSDFVKGGAGNKPSGFQPVTKALKVTCTGNTTDTATVTMRLQGTAAAGAPVALKSDNKDVGVVVADNLGNPLIPNSTTGGVAVNLQKGLGTTSIETYPISLTGAAPAVGLFTSLSTLVFEFD